MSVRGGEWTVESARGGGVFSCNDSAPVVARLSGGRFFQLTSLVTDAKATGPLALVFRPEFAEVPFPHAGAKVKVDRTA